MEARSDDYPPMDDGSDDISVEVLHHKFILFPKLDKSPTEAGDLMGVGRIVDLLGDDLADTIDQTGVDHTSLDWSTHRW